MRLTVARRGAILASLVILLGLILASQQPLAQQYTPTPTPTPREAYMVHTYVTVRARDLERYEFYVCDGCRFAIIFYVYDTSWGSSDIIFRALDPEGREIHPRGKVGRLQWSFTAERPGTYVLEFDNTYSTLGKYVDLALAVRPPPTTTTMVEYRTLTATEYRTAYRVVTETLTVTPILSWESILILAFAVAVAFIAGILLTLLVRRYRK